MSDPGGEAPLLDSSVFGAQDENQVGAQIQGAFRSLVRASQELPLGGGAYGILCRSRTR